MFRMKSVMIGAIKIWFDHYAGHCIVSNFTFAGHCIVSNFRLHCDSHSQIPIIAASTSAMTLARSNLIRLPSLDWPSTLTCCISIVVSPPCGSLSFLAYHMVALAQLKVMPSSLQKFTFGLHLLLTPGGMTLATSKTRILNKATFTLPTLYSRVWPLPSSFSFKFLPLATCQATTWLVITRPVAASCHPSSVLSQAFDQFHFAIFDICPHTLAGCFLWSEPETQRCFGVHPPLRRAHQPLCILHRFYKTTPHVMCVYR